MQDYLFKLGIKARRASQDIVNSDKKNDILKDYLNLILNNQAKIISENQKDLKKAKLKGLKGNLIKRLLLDKKKILQITDSIKTIISFKDPVNQIVEAVKRCLEQTPPELAADILERGIILAGGGSLLKGIDQIIRERTNVPVNVSEDPFLSVVKGTGMVLENLKKYEAGLL